MARHEIWPTARKLRKAPRWALKKVVFFEKVRHFAVLDEGNCQTAWLFAYWGPCGRERRAGPHGADPPHFHMHRGKIGQFFEARVFPAAQVGLGVDGPHKTAENLQNTPRTPPVCRPLAAAGSQSALYDSCSMQVWLTSTCPQTLIVTVGTVLESANAKKSRQFSLIHLHCVLSLTYSQGPRPRPPAWPPPIRSKVCMPKSVNICIAIQG